MRKLLVITAFILVTGAIIATVLLNSYHSGSPSVSTNTNVNADSTTKNTTFSEEPLIDSGVTSQQLGNLEQALGQYLSSQNKKPDQVSFTSIKRLPTNPNTTTPFSEITFIIQLDNKDTYYAKMDSFSLSEIRLYLYNQDGNKLLYDSQNIGGSSY